MDDCGNLKDFGRKPQDYDAIFTGDLGSVGQQALFELLSQENIDISDRHYDCGLLIYDTEKQDGTRAEAAAAARRSCCRRIFCPNLPRENGSGYCLCQQGRCSTRHLLMRGRMYRESPMG